MTGVFGSNFPDIVSYAVIRRLNIDSKVSKLSTAKQTLRCRKPEVRMANGGVVRSDKIVY